MEILKTIGRLMPEKTVNDVDSFIKQSGSSIDGDTFIGIAIVLTLIYAMLFILLFLFKPINEIFYGIASDITKEQAQIQVLSFIIYSIFGIVLYFFIATLIYGYYVFKSDMRRNAVESVLPDFFSLVSSNIRGGMTLEQALWQAAKPEFGILSIEVKASIKEAFAGTPMDKALDNLSKRFNSPILSRTLSMIKEALKSGGELAVVLEKTADEARDIIISKKEIRTSLLVSIIFLIFASSIGVPAVLAVTNMLIQTLEKTFTFTSGQQTTSVGGINISLSKPPFSSREFLWFSIITIFINVFIASFIVSVAYTGTKRQAFRFFPLMLITAYIIFFIATAFVSSLMLNIG
ncbi:MAG: type II secretion system F family protein [Candidatus Anstonellales archaeon]